MLTRSRANPERPPDVSHRLGGRYGFRSPRFLFPYAVSFSRFPGGLQGADSAEALCSAQGLATTISWYPERYPADRHTLPSLPEYPDRR